MLWTCAGKRVHSGPARSGRRSREETMNIATRATTDIAVPFDQKRVDGAMDDAGIDVLLASSKHNVQYLLGGYKFIFFAAMDAIGHSRYLPVLLYEKGQPEHASYLGNRMETG